MNIWLLHLIMVFCSLCIPVFLTAVRSNQGLDQMMATYTFKRWSWLIFLSGLCYALIFYLRHLLPKNYQDIFVQIIFLLVIASQFFLPKEQVTKDKPKTVSKPLGYIILISNLVFGGFLLSLWRSSPEVWLFPVTAVFIILIGAIVARKLITKS